MALLYYGFFLFLAVTKLSGTTGFCKKDDQEVFSYHGWENGVMQWNRLFPSCNGIMQSPINIETKYVRLDRHLKKLSFFKYDAPIKQANVTNDGRTVTVTPRDNIKRGITVQGKDYNLENLHFHWGSEEYPGGEHMLDGKEFEMEAHFVHRSSDNKTAVVGLLVQMTKRDNRAFNPIVEILPKVLYKDKSTGLKSPLRLDKLVPKIPASYYGYTGSLTVPMCTEGVSWFVLQKKQTIGWKQLNSFLKVYSVRKEDQSDECLLAPNNRVIQNLNGRIIYASK